MTLLRSLAVFLMVSAVTCSTIPAKAGFHLWSIAEVFSNHDGSVQFIELVSAGSAERVAVNAEIRTTSATPDNVFDFPANLVGNTLNKRLLIATPGFALLPGAVVPDYTFSQTEDFFDLAGDTIRLFQPSFSEFHSRTFGAVPTDGVMSLNFPPAGGTSLGNTPTNYAGQIGSINLPPPEPDPTGDYNQDGTVDAADYVHWRKTLDESVSPNGSGADGSGDGTINEADYDYWLERFATMPTGSSHSGPIPEPATIVLSFVAVTILCVPRRRRR